MSVDFTTVDGCAILKGTAEAPLVCSFADNIEEVTVSLEGVLYVAKQGGKCVIGLKASGGTITVASSDVYDDFQDGLTALSSMGGMGDEEEEESDEEEAEEEPPVPKKKAKKA
eukprot:TRINITY_DN5518_c0_g1_i1.p1 TRINITY_DN5518_c0_g1~~TRINITY_DN5518_c0_g1_i1.p1  ORF type:complete len:121 (-),score=53.91 TRINITY_DN5518_c0_g1_i1:174-512(-)